MPKLSALDQEVEEIIKDVKALAFTNEIKILNNMQMDAANQNGLELTILEQDNSDEETYAAQPINTSEIKFFEKKSNKRLACACHKLNLVIRGAIKKCNELKRIISILNKSNDHIRRSIELSRVFTNLKCRLRMENLTRWSSLYLLLESVKRAYDNGKCLH